MFDFVKEDPGQARRKSPAILIGDSLLPELLPQSLPDLLEITAQLHPDRGLTFVSPGKSDDFHSYAKLAAEAKNIAAGLRTACCKAGDKIILQLGHPGRFLAAFWGCLFGGFVPVPIPVNASLESDSHHGQRLLHAWNLLNSPVIVTDSQLFTTIDTLISGKHPVYCIEDLFTRQSEACHQSGRDDVAAILMTSGSTGVPKLVTLTHGNILSSIGASASVHSFTSEDISLNWLPLYHGGGLMRSIRDIFVGCTQYQAMTCDVLPKPLQWLDWIHEKSVTTSWAPNFAFAMIVGCRNEINGKQWRLDSIRSLATTGEPVSLKTMRAFTELLQPFGFRKSSMHVSWGLTEAFFSACSLDYLSKDEQFPREHAEVGKPIPGVSIRIVDSKDQVVTEGCTGSIQVVGSSVTPGYYGKDVLHSESFTKDGWLRTGDIGVLQNGCLIVTGRQKELFSSGGVKFSYHEIETVVEQLDGVTPSYTAAFAIRRPPDTLEHLVIFFHAARQDDWFCAELISTIRSQIARKLGISPRHILPVSKSSIPRTAAGKIGRSILKERFERGDFEERIKQVQSLMKDNPPAKSSKPASTQLETRIAQCFRQVLDRETIASNDNFFELGGNSIQVLQLTARLSEIFRSVEISTVEIFRNPTVESLASYYESKATSRIVGQTGMERGNIRKAHWQRRRGIRSDEQTK